MVEGEVSKTRIPYDDDAIKAATAFCQLRLHAVKPSRFANRSGYLRSHAFPNSNHATRSRPSFTEVTDRISEARPLFGNLGPKLSGSSISALLWQH
jgi:hypothetical protein